MKSTRLPAAMRPERTCATRPAIALPVYTGSSSQRLVPRRQRRRLAHRIVEPAVARRVHLVGDFDVARVERRRALDHRRQLGRHLRRAIALPAGVPPHADAVDRHRLAQRPQAHQNAGVGERAARGADHRVEPDTESRGLRHEFLGGDDVAEPAERRMPRGGVNDVRPATLAGERPGEALQRRVRRRLVLAHGERVQRRTEQPVEQQVARIPVEMAGVVHAVFELDVRVHPEPARAGGGEADEVRLHRPGGQHGVGAPRLRLTEVELELAHLVAPKGEPRAVVALDPQLDPEGRAEAGRRVERGRRVAEPDSREPVDGGKRA